MEEAESKIYNRIIELEAAAVQKQQTITQITQQVVQLRTASQQQTMDFAGITASLVELKMLVGLDPEQPYKPEPTPTPEPAHPQAPAKLICDKCSGVFGSDPENSLSIQEGDHCPSCEKGTLLDITHTTDRDPTASTPELSKEELIEQIQRLSGTNGDQDLIKTHIEAAGAMHIQDLDQERLGELLADLAATKTPKGDDPGKKEG